MKRQGRLALMALACIAVAGCGKKDEKPTGQVVATVRGEEITAIDLRNELGNFAAPDARTRKMAEQQALNQIIARKLLAAAADKAGVAKTPEYAQQETRMKEALLVQVWQNQIIKSVPAPSREEAEQFVAQHPDMYAHRKLLSVDQLRFPRPTDPNVVLGLRPLNTIEEVTAFLNSRGIRSQSDQGTIDTLNLDPSITSQILALPPGEVFVVPAGNLLVANRLRESREAPVVGDPAIKHATAYLKATRSRDAARRQFEQVMAAQKKEVVYAKAYEPTPPPKAAPKAAAPAAKAGAPAPAAGAPAAAAPTAPATK